MKNELPVQEEILQNTAPRCRQPAPTKQNPIYTHRSANDCSSSAKRPVARFAGGACVSHCRRPNETKSNILYTHRSAKMIVHPVRNARLHVSRVGHVCNCLSLKPRFFPNSLAFHQGHSGSITIGQNLDTGIHRGETCGEAKAEAKGQGAHLTNQARSHLAVFVDVYRPITAACFIGIP